MNILTTKCTSCVFKEELGCRLGKHTIWLDDHQQTPGFCRYKRLTSWGHDKENLLGAAQQEENKLSLVVPCLDMDKEKIEYTVSQYSQNDNINSICLVVPDSKPFSKELARLLEEKDTKNWMVENIFESDINFNDAVHQVVLKQKFNWFLPIESGEQLPNNLIREFFKHISIDSENYLVFYHDPFVITNKFGFFELGGNVEKSFIEKVKNFNNWRNVCLEID